MAYTPKKIMDYTEFVSRQKVTAEDWNFLFKSLIEQGNRQEELIADLINNRPIVDEEAPEESVPGGGTTPSINLGNYYTKGQTDLMLADKVNKDGNKVLSDNNFTNALKNKLESMDLTKYLTADQIYKLIEGLQSVAIQIMELECTPSTATTGTTQSVVISWRLNKIPKVLKINSNVIIQAQLAEGNLQQGKIIYSGIKVDTNFTLYVEDDNTNHSQTTKIDFIAPAVETRLYYGTDPSSTFGASLFSTLSKSNVNEIPDKVNFNTTVNSYAWFLSPKKITQIRDSIATVPFIEVDESPYVYQGVKYYCYRQVVQFKVAIARAYEITYGG